MNLKIFKLPGSKRRLRKSELIEYESAKPYLKNEPVNGNNNQTKG